ncbi:RnhA Ribonuclease HI [uncultured Caudovirales phage]|uniref:RnhA Ribonuclease HI n=1 Tax=uncultured Caudovirales phage TaxID=2100421 RepID=A0A6J5RHB8_9CAUD|nr:RnhA Ribonuclease HI [uncultured Caudovirales phage]CAB4192981.1 RnhA Ribonuclease HI [uncultured Caudovirales phage]CAB4217681.1 RnhA Ribonuclease HI [uncultured Caudovirales phage]CAB5231488.1 RnhA Ribonuclease HI [uncultured Caudovirales phage]
MGIGIWAFTGSYENPLTVAEIAEYVGEGTSFKAEYYAAIEAFKFIKKYQASLRKKLGITEVRMFNDSESVVRQINGDYKISEPSIKILYDLVIVLRSQCSLNITLTHVRREYNTQADVLSKEALTYGRSNSQVP